MLRWPAQQALENNSKRNELFWGVELFLVRSDSLLCASVEIAADKAAKLAGMAKATQNDELA